MLDKPRQYKTTEAEPFDGSKIYDWRHKYNINNMLMREVNWPSHYYEHDFINSQWSDRDYDAFEKACSLLDKNSSFDSNAALRALSNNNFIHFCKVACGYEGEITGARVVRYSNQGGYSVYRIDIWWHNPKNPDALHETTVKEAKRLDNEWKNRWSLREYSLDD